MVTKKNSEKKISDSTNWVQVTTLIISIFGIWIWLLWVYLTWMVTKTNEIETRLYQQRFELYKSVGDSIIDFRTNIDDKNYLEKAKKLRSELKRIGYQMRVIGTPEVICRYWVLLSAIDGYIEFTKESPSHIFTDYNRDIIPTIFYFEKSIRNTLLQDEERINFSLDQEDPASLHDECNTLSWNFISLDQYK